MAEYAKAYTVNHRAVASNQIFERLLILSHEELRQKIFGWHVGLNVGRHATNSADYPLHDSPRSERLMCANCPFELRRTQPRKNFAGWTSQWFLILRRPMRVGYRGAPLIIPCRITKIKLVTFKSGGQGEEHADENLSE